MEIYTSQLFDIEFRELKSIFEAHFDREISKIDFVRSGDTVGMPGICGEYARHYDIALYLGAPDPLNKWDAGRRGDYVDYFIERAAAYGRPSLSYNALEKELYRLWYARTINLWEWLPHEYGGPSYTFWPAGRNKDERCRNLQTRLNAIVEARRSLIH